MGSFSKRLTAVVAAGAVSALAASAAQGATFETVAIGLDNPRGVAYNPVDGAIYVANAGRGGRQCQGEGEEAMCLGTTGRIVRVEGRQKRTIARDMVSVAGQGGVFASGLHGVSVAPDGSVFAVTGSATPADLRGLPRPVKRRVGRLFRATGGAFRSVARVDRLEHRRNLDNVKGDRNSNPYAVLALADRQIVVDAGANAVLEVRDGNVELLSLIPNRRNGRRQSVPTSIALGPDGAYYVGELAEASGRGKARVWRVPPEGGDATVYRSGFTTISGVAFGPDGSLFVTEFALNFRTLKGRLWQVRPDGTRTLLAGGKKLRAPTGAAVDPTTGAVYVSNYSVLPRRTPQESPFRGRGGTLVKITP